MANLIYIQIISGNIKTEEKNDKTKIQKASLTVTKKEQIMVFPLTEDLKLDVGSEMGAFSDMLGLGGLSDLIEIVQSLTAGTLGQQETGLTDLGNMFNVPRWKKTRPVSFQVKLPFYTISDPYEDVVKPMANLMALTILSVTNNGKSFIVPGISAGSLKVTSKKANTTQTNNPVSTSAKLISVKIPGIIHLPVAMMLEASPTYSKQLTVSGYPLWGELECKITSLYPATDDLFAKKE